MPNRPDQFKVSVIIPALNEEGSITSLLAKVTEALHGYPDYEILIIDDGSRDGTLAMLKSAHAENPRVQFLSFSRNFGHQAAIKAGLDHAAGDCVISMDADLQHPPRMLPELIEKWREGYDVVYTLRRQDPSLSWFKRKTSAGFYWLLNRLADIRIDQGAADFRLLDRAVVDVLRDDINEYHLFLRGLIVWLGFRQIGIEYTPDKRHAGVTKYSMKRMIALALAGITSFSVKPLHISVLLGIGCAGAAFFYGFYAAFMRIFTNRAIPGWASVLVSVLLIGGIQLIVLGIIGEYLGKLVMESKHRPHYILCETSLNGKDARATEKRSRPACLNPPI
jgi:dolichol-phosphate mannosyltransferase